MKQSSVDWLFDQLWETPRDKITWFKILMEAKEKHEREIIDSYRVGEVESTMPISNRLYAAVNYYNENFK
jgi:hypothetical protein